MTANSNTTSIKKIEEKHGKLLIHSRTSVYELLKSEMGESDENTILLPKKIITAEGSEYTYLENGKTQRFKTVEQDMKEQQDVLVFIPRINSLKEWAHYDHLPNWVKEYTDDQVKEILAREYVHNTSRRVFLVDGSGKIIRNNQEASVASELLLSFGNQETTDFALPVSTDPSLGSNTFDARFFKNEAGEDVYSCHIGNTVINIEYQNEH